MNTWITMPDTMAASLTGLVIAFGAGHEPKVAVPRPSTIDATYLYRSGNVAVPIAILPAPPTGDALVDHYQPRTALGRRLLALRRAYLESGGRLLTQDEILDEVRRLRSD